MSTGNHDVQAGGPRLTPAQTRIMRQLRDGARMYHGQASRSTDKIIMASAPTIHAMQDKDLIAWDAVNHTFALTKRGKAIDL